MGGGSRSCILETVDCVEDDRATTITADGEGGGKRSPDGAL